MLLCLSYDHLAPSERLETKLTKLVDGLFKMSKTGLV